VFPSSAIDDWSKSETSDVDLGEGQGGGYLRIHDVDDGLQNSRPVAEDFRVPEAKNSIALRAQPFVALSIMRRIGRVLSAIDLDNQSPLLTHEIDDERTDRYLVSKAQAPQTMSTEHEPQAALGICHVPAQSLCAPAMKF